MNNSNIDLLCTTHNTYNTLGQKIETMDFDGDFQIIVDTINPKPLYGRDLVLEFLDKINELAEISYQRNNTVCNIDMRKCQDLGKSIMVKIQTIGYIVSTQSKIGPPNIIIIPDSILSNVSTHLSKIDEQTETPTHMIYCGYFNGIKVYSTDKVNDILIYRNNVVGSPGVVAFYDDNNLSFVELGIAPWKNFIKIKLT